MIVRINLIILISLILLATLPRKASAEYLRATEQDELILVSSEQEVKMGQSLAEKVEKRFGLSQDELLQKWVKDIGGNIAKICDRQDITYHFKVIVGKELEVEERINAFALPGGYVYIFEELLNKLKDDDELASVLAHEVGHITAKHSVKRLQSSYGLMALQLITSQIEAANETRARAYDAINQLMMSYSRDEEFMADKLSVKYTKQAGFDPQGTVKVINKLIKIQREAPARRFAHYRTHPYLSERKAMLRQEIHGQMEFVDFINMPE